MNECICFDNVSYILNKEEKTADIKTFLSKASDFYIPRSINYQSQEYIVTSILSSSVGSKVKSIQFAPDSELKTIEKSAFIYSKIESFFIPSSLIELEEGWCENIEKLTEITISPQNPKYKLYNNNMIIGKSSLDSQNYDTLVFCCRNIEEVIIPNFVEVIEPYAIKNIFKIKINSDSKLRILKNCSIGNSYIESIYIPPSVVSIQERCFLRNPCLKKITVDPKNKMISVYDKKLLIAKSSPEKENFDVVLFCLPGTIKVTIPDFIEVIAPRSFEECIQLQNVEISHNSKLQSIEEYAFYESTITSITIPPHLKKIGKCAFYYCGSLTQVNITPDSELRTIEEYSFSQTMINSFFIPKLVTKICKNTFDNCVNLNRIEIPENSNLEVIESEAFCSTLIEKIQLPQNFKKFDKKWNHFATELKKISFSPNNKFFDIVEDKIVVTKSDPDQENFDTLVFYMGDDEIVKISDSIEVIGSGAFSNDQNLVEVVIPENLRIIEESAFLKCANLKKVLIPSNSQLQEIDSFAFSETLIENFFIPSHMKIINDLSFFKCIDLKKVEIATNSELELIGFDAFGECSSIESISFPPSLKVVSSIAFKNCSNLKDVEIDPNIQLDKLDNFLFYSTSIEEFSIPASVTSICSGAFNDCTNLKRIEIPKNSKLEVIFSRAFRNTQIESIFFPSNLVDLKDGWCINTNKLKEIIVDQRNESFIFVDNKFLLSKSSPEKENFDVLVFCASNIENVTIPDFVEIIGPYSFNSCKNLKKVDICKESKLRIIDECAFDNCSIECITIPLHVNLIGPNAFNNCKYLRNVEFQNNSELKIIENGAFSNCSLRNISFPPSLQKIYDNAFKECKELCSIEFPNNSELNIIGESAFNNTKIKGILLPCHLKRICYRAFLHVIIVELGESSDIEFIDKFAFSPSLEIIMVPPKVSKEFLMRVKDVFSPKKCNKNLLFEYSIKYYRLLLCILGFFCLFFLYLVF